MYSIYHETSPMCAHPGARRWLGTCPTHSGTDSSARPCSHSRPACGWPHNRNNRCHRLHCNPVRTWPCSSGWCWPHSRDRLHSLRMLQKKEEEEASISWMPARRVDRSDCTYPPPTGDYRCPGSACRHPPSRPRWCETVHIPQSRRNGSDYNRWWPRRCSPGRRRSQAYLSMGLSRVGTRLL